MREKIQQYNMIAMTTVCQQQQEQQEQEQEQEQCKTTTQTTIQRVAHLLVVDVNDVATAADAATRVHLNSGQIPHTKNNLENKTRAMDHHNSQSQP